MSFLYPQWQTMVASAPKKPGLYCVYAHSTVLYIGKSANLFNRLKNHNLRDLATRNGVTHIETIVVEDEWQRHAMERYLIAKHDPKNELSPRIQSGQGYL